MNPAAVAAHIGCMNLTAIAALSHSPFGLILSATDDVLTWVALIASLIHNHAVRGSHRRHAAVTVVKTCLPVMFAADTFFIVIFFADGNWPLLGGRILSWLFEIWWWKDVDDEDSWWTGRGKKIRQWFRKTFTASSPAAAGAGA